MENQSLFWAITIVVVLSIVGLLAYGSDVDACTKRGGHMIGVGRIGTHLCISKDGRVLE